MTNRLCLAVIITMMTASWGCGSRSANPVGAIFKKSLFNEDEANAMLQQGLKPSDSILFRDLKIGLSSAEIDQYVDNIYAYRGELSQGMIWLGSKSLSTAYEEFVKMADSAVYHGLQADVYTSTDTTIQKVLDAYEDGTELKVADVVKAEKRLTRNFLKLNSDLLYGVNNPRKFFSHKIWSASNDSSHNILQALEIISIGGGGHRLIDSLTTKHPWYLALVSQMTNLLHLESSDSLTEIRIDSSLQLGDSSAATAAVYRRLGGMFGLASGEIGTRYDTQLLSLVERFQRMHRQDIDSIIDAEFIAQLNEPIDDQIARLRRDFERWHWGKKDYNSEYVLVNIPEFRLYYYVDDSIQMHMNCVVGKTSRMTPTIDARMTDIVINPTWTVPPTILKKDILPSIKRRGGYAVARRGLTAYDSRGRKVNPARINSSNYKYYRYVQKPSYHNSLGTIKFNMPNRELVYIHDTNHRWGFDAPVRTRSSGCVRVQHPRDMATMILSDQGYTRDIIDSLIKKADTRSVKLERDIMAHFTYLTSGLDSTGSLVYYKDVYRLDTIFTKNLAQL